MVNFDFTQSDITTLRAATPGIKNVVHFNNAGAALMPAIVGNKVIEYIQRELQYGGYETAEYYSRDIKNTHAAIARYLGCSSAEIAIMENATAAWNQAFLSIPFEPGDCILTSASEYASNYIPFLQMKKRVGVSIIQIPNDNSGQVDVPELSKLVHDKVKLIAISHVPTNGGLVNPAASIGEIAKEHNIWYLLDACQSVGQMPLNVKEIGCNFLSATSRKFLRGPRGVGFLYVDNHNIPQLEPVAMDLHAAEWQSRDYYQPRTDGAKFENWEKNLAGVVGLGVAVEYMLDLGIDKIWARIQRIAQYLRGKLSAIPGVEVHDLGTIKCGIVSFTLSAEAPQSLKSKLHDAGFNVSIIHPSHTLLDMQSRNLGHMIRASVHYYNTEDEIDKFASFIRCL